MIYHNTAQGRMPYTLSPECCFAGRRKGKDGGCVEILLRMVPREFLFLLLMLVGGGGLEDLVNMAYLLFVAVCAGAQRAAADWVRRRIGRQNALA